MMSLKKKVASALAVGAIVLGGMMLAAPAAQATGNPSSLDQGDLSIACKMSTGKSGATAQLFGSTAYSWKCVVGGVQSNVDVNAYCMHYWGVWAMTTNPSSPYSWKCQGY